MPDLISALLLISCVNLGKLPNIFELLFPEVWHERLRLDDFHPLLLWRYVPRICLLNTLASNGRQHSVSLEWLNQEWEENNSSHLCTCLLVTHLNPNPFCGLDVPGLLGSCSASMSLCCQWANAWEGGFSETERVKHFWTGNLASAQQQTRKSWFAKLTEGAELVWGTRPVLFGCSAVALLSLGRREDFRSAENSNTVQRLWGFPRTFGQWSTAGAMKSCFRQGVTLKN